MSELRCPICKRPVDDDRTRNKSWPFCSKRCRAIDLGRWLGEEYRIPADESPSEEGEMPVPPRGEKEK